jgi:hypothetical protein
MSIGTIRHARQAILAVALVASFSVVAQANDQDGIIKVKSSYPMSETINRIKKDVAEKSYCQMLVTEGIRRRFEFSSSQPQFRH